MFPTLILFATLTATAFTQDGRVPCVNQICPSGSTCGSDNFCNPSCEDKVNPNTGVSDCPRMAAYCDDPAYKSLLYDQCPKTCNTCGTTTTCQDKVNPNTGVSDCAKNANFCQVEAYKALMKEQCPKTCKYC